MRVCKRGHSHDKKNCPVCSRASKLSRRHGVTLEEALKIPPRSFNGKVEDGHKGCPKCRKSKPTSEFYLLAGGKVASYCKECSSTSQKQWRYGISKKELVELQSTTQCAICDSDGGVRGLFIDHCHSTGSVRGMLCHQCNAAIGLMNDDSVRLMRAIEYLGGAK